VLIRNNDLSPSTHHLNNIVTHIVFRDLEVELVVESLSRLPAAPGARAELGSLLV